MPDCSHCHAPNREGANFCLSCGRPFQQRKALSTAHTPSRRSSAKQSLTVQLERSDWTINPPEPIGKNALKVKGAGVKSNLDYAQQRVGDEVFEAIVASIREPDLHKFLTQPILNGSMYDVFGVAAFNDYVAAALNMNMISYITQASRNTAELDTQGLYKHLVTTDSPIKLIKRMDAMAAQYYNYVDASSEIIDDTSALLTRVLPRIALDIYNAQSEAYIETHMYHTGAHLVDVQAMPLEDVEPKLGFPTVRCQKVFRWRPR